MQYVSLTKFCEMTGLTTDEIKDYEARGLISGTSKGTIRFYSLRETYRAKGILYFMRTQGLSAEEAAIKMDDTRTMDETRAAGRLRSNDQDSPAPAD